MGIKNQTFDDRDTTNLKYAGGWPVPNDGSWNASSVGESGTLSSTKDPTANVTFTFPIPANAIYYYGIPRCCGGLYAICVDCDPNAPVFETIDAVNRSDDGKNPPIVLWSRTFNDFGIHEIILTNQQDPRFGNNSQITIDRFDLQVEDNSADGASPSSSQFSLQTTAPQTSSTPSGTTSSATSTSSQSSTPVGAIVGGVVGGIAVLAMVIFMWLFLRRRASRPPNTEAPSMSYAGPRPFTTTSFTTISAPSQSTYTSPIATSGSIVGYGDGKHKRGQRSQPLSDFSSSSEGSTSRLVPMSAPIRSSTPSLPPPPLPHLPRRETDAGRIHGDEFDEEEGTLPPEYDQVFRRFDNGQSSNSPEGGRLSAPIQSASSGVLTGKLGDLDLSNSSDIQLSSPRRRKF